MSVTGKALILFPTQGVFLLHLNPNPEFFLKINFPFLFSPSGQIQEVSLGQDQPPPQVEVTPDLDLEVVPESSGDWHNVFPD